MNWSKLKLIPVLFLVVVPTSVYADLADLLNKFQPYIVVGEEYNSNINLTPENRKHDFITTISPGLRVSTLARSTVTGQFREPLSTLEEKYGMDMDYRLALAFYGKDPHNNYVGYDGTFLGWYTFDRKLTFRLKTYSLRSEEPIEPDYSSNAIPGQILLGSQRTRAIYFRNILEPSLEYRFGRDDLFSVNYRGNFYNNEDPQFANSAENFVNPKLTYWFNIRNGMALEYALTLGNFQRSPNLTGHMVLGRYTYRFDPRTSVFGEYSFLQRNFKSFSQGDYDVHRPTLGVEYAFTPTLSGRAQLGYFWENPKEGSQTGGLYYDVNLTRRSEKTTYALTFQGGYTEDYFTAENLGFVKYHRVIGAVTHQLRERMTAELSGYLEKGTYTSDRRDDLWGIRGNLSYRVLKWLTPSLEVSCRQNHSNDDKFDYTEYRAIFRITAAY